MHVLCIDIHAWSPADTMAIFTCNTVCQNIISPYDHACIISYFLHNVCENHLTTQHVPFIKLEYF